MNIYLNVLHTTVNWYSFSDKPEKNKHMQETKNPCDDFVDNIGNTVKYFAGTFGKVCILQHYLDFKLFHTIILLLLYFLVFQMNICLNVYRCLIFDKFHFSKTVCWEEK